MLKKIIISILIVLILFGVGVVIYNSFDESLNPKSYTYADLKPATFDPANGYYLLWGLGEPEGVDVQSEEYTKSFRKIFDPGIRDKKAPVYDPLSNPLSKKKQFEIYSKAIRSLKFPQNDSCAEDWITTLNPQSEKLSEVQQTCALLLKRYRALIDSPRVEDFSYPSADVPIPHLLGLLHSAKLYTAISTAKAVKGQWQEAVADFLAQVDFAKRLVSTSRPQINNLIAKAVMNYSLSGLVNIMNHPGCPPSVYTQVIEGMPPLKYEEYGNRNSIIFEYLTGSGILDELPRYAADGEKKMLPFTKQGFLGRLFLQKNTTKNYFYDYFSHCLAYDSQEPSLWKTDPRIELEWLVMSKTSSFFWRLKNPVGKVIYSIYAPSCYVSIFKAYRLRCRYEMTRLLAELKREYSPSMTVSDLLPKLKTYRWHDPFSGKPYKWNPGKNVLYSIGIDGVDNGGIENTTTYKTDIMVPVVIKK